MRSLQLPGPWEAEPESAELEWDGAAAYPGSSARRLTSSSGRCTVVVQSARAGCPERDPTGPDSFYPHPPMPGPHMLRVSLLKLPFQHSLCVASALSRARAAIGGLAHRMEPRGRLAGRFVGGLSVQIT